MRKADKKAIIVQKMFKAPAAKLPTLLQSCLDQTGQVWTNRDESGPAWTSLDLSG